MPRRDWRHDRLRSFRSRESSAASDGRRGWFHWSQHDLRGIPEPKRSDGQYEYATYLQQAGAGDDLRENTRGLAPLLRRSPAAPRERASPASTTISRACFSRAPRARARPRSRLHRRRGSSSRSPAGETPSSLRARMSMPLRRWASRPGFALRSRSGDSFGSIGRARRAGRARGGEPRYRGDAVFVSGRVLDAADLEAHVQRLRWVYETQRVSVLRRGTVCARTREGRTQTASARFRVIERRVAGHLDGPGRGAAPSAPLDDDDLPPAPLLPGPRDCPRGLRFLCGQRPTRAEARSPAPGGAAAEESRSPALRALPRGDEAAAAGRWAEAKERLRAVLVIRSSPKVSVFPRPGRGAAGSARERAGRLRPVARRGATEGKGDVVQAAEGAQRALGPRVPHIRLLLSGGGGGAGAEGHDVGVSGASATVDDQPSRSVPLCRSIPGSIASSSARAGCGPRRSTSGSRRGSKSIGSSLSSPTRPQLLLRYRR